MPLEFNDQRLALGSLGNKMSLLRLGFIQLRDITGSRIYIKIPNKSSIGVKATFASSWLLIK